MPGLSAIRTRAELVFRQRVALAFRALRDRTDAARVVREGVDAVPFDAVLGVRLLGDAMRVFRNTYEAAGDKAAAELKTKLVRKADDHEVKVEEWTFDVLNSRGLEFLQQHAAKRVVEIVDATRDALRALLSDMHNQGVPAIEQAKRIKQVVGLTTRDARAVENLRERLRDDGMAPARAEKLVARKAAELLAQRALTIARTENAFAASAGQRESWAQAANDGLFDPTEAQRAWMTSEDEQTCPICEPMDGQTVGMNEPFTTGEGEAIDEPPAHPNCRCDVVLRISEGRLAA